ncbi:MAG: 2-amino-4-hydroxy-6-hydroxymethyldihydropteridine diphosphokinase [Thermodesulfobacteriota bacterium]
MIGLGSNLGDGCANLLAAWQRLGEVPGVTTRHLSSPYRSEPVGVATDHWFTNAVGEVVTSLPALALLDAMLAIETAMGRDRSLGHDRPVDLDLLDYDGQVLETPRLRLPHPELARRLFVLAPLGELDREWRHPVLGSTAQQLLVALEQPEQVERLAWPSQGE